ncbi:hypothetical protein [Sphingomonas spermidinifaciens]|uniref:hypothetical protein n=1 Tax=Sphingomonas spermidinifaciens TaxID=1141889 RepID=UPI001FE65F19|nr:hypothetical protein [Sphingomonas spermidinifaciens]
MMNPLGVLTFAGLTAAGIAARRRTAWHRRLHYCAMAVLIGPAFGRLLPMPLLIPYAGEVVFAALMLFPLAGCIADLRRAGRVHPAFVAAIGVMLTMQVAINLVTFSPAGAAIYRAVTAGSPGGTVDPYAFAPSPPPVP